MPTKMVRGLMLAIMLARPTLAAPSDVVVQEASDAATQVRSAHWLDHEGGHHGNEVRSPDGRWRLYLIPVADLDVMTYQVSLRTPQGGVTQLCSQALDATFSPDSQSVFVSTGPNPFVYRLKPAQKTVLTAISSGLENNPVWVSSWTPDGHHLVLHQQKRYDSKTEPRVWNVTLP